MKNFSTGFLLAASSCVLGLFSSAYAQPGNGIRVGEQTLMVPEIKVGYNYTDNVAIRGISLSDEEGGTLSNPESDSYYNYLASLRFTRVSENRHFHLTGWYGQDAYQDYSDLDAENYGVGGGWLWARPEGSTTAQISGRYEHAVDRAGSDEVELGSNKLPEIEDVSERVERDIISADVEITQDLTASIGSAFIFSYFDTDYTEERYNDRTSFDYILELNYRYSDKSLPYLRVGYGLDDDQGFVDNAEKPFIVAGLRYTVSEKLRFNIAAGYETYTRTPIDSEELEDSGLKYTLTADYKATAKSKFRFRARNGYDSVSFANSSSRKENVVSLLYRHQTTRKLRQDLLLSYRHDDYLSPITVSGEEIDELKTTIRYQYQLNYQTVQPWLSLFGRISYEDGESKIPDQSYDETEISLGATLRY